MQKNKRTRHLLLSITAILLFIPAVSKAGFYIEICDVTLGPDGCATADIDIWNDNGTPGDANDDFLVYSGHVKSSDCATGQEAPPSDPHGGQCSSSQSGYLAEILNAYIDSSSGLLRLEADVYDTSEELQLNFDYYFPMQGAIK